MRPTFYADFHDRITFAYRCIRGHWVNNGTSKVGVLTITCVDGVWTPNPFVIRGCVGKIDECTLLYFALGMKAHFARKMQASMRSILRMVSMDKSRCQADLGFEMKF